MRETEHEPEWLRILSIDVESCLVAPADKSGPLEQLRSADKTLFLAELSKVARAIDADRRRSIEEIKRFTTEAKNNPSLLPQLPEESFTARLAEALRSGEETLRAARLERAQHDKALAWGHRSRQMIATLYELEFPTAN